MFENLGRKSDDPGLGSNAPKPPPLVNPLEGHDVALYVDGKRVSMTYMTVSQCSDHSVGVYIETTVEAALNPAVNATESLAWNGFKPMDHVGVRIGEDQPQSGVMLIEHIILPETDGEDAKFRGRALTPIWNLKTGKQIAAAEDPCTIAVAHAVRISSQGPQL